MVSALGTDPQSCGDGDASLRAIMMSASSRGTFAFPYSNSTLTLPPLNVVESIVVGVARDLVLKRYKYISQNLLFVCCLKPGADGAAAGAIPQTAPSESRRERFGAIQLRADA
jgi:hypothetical protein